MDHKLTVDAAKKGAIPHIRDVKQFLTFTFKTTSSSRQQIYFEILSFLVENPSGYNSQIANYFNRSRQTVHVAIKKLLKYKIIKIVGRRSSGVYYKLVEDVKKYIKQIKADNVKNDVKKVGGGVSSSASSPVPSHSDASADVKQMSKNVLNKSDIYRLHRHAAYCRYVKGTQPKLSKSRYKNQERYLISLSLPDGEWDVEFTKNYTIIRGPNFLGTLGEFELTEERFLMELGKVVEIVQRRYPIELDLEKVEKECNNKFEIACQDPFHKWFAKQYVDKNQTIHEKDFTIDGSQGPEVDLVQNYDGAEGVRKYKASLDLSDKMLPAMENFSKTIVQMQSQLDEKETITFNILEQISHNLLENTYLFKDLREEIHLSMESLRAEIQQKTLKYEAGEEFEQKGVITLRAGEERQVKHILALLQEGEKTQKELAQEMNYNSTAAISVAIKYLDKNKLVQVETIETGKRGRPTKRYKLLNKE